eukprot:15444327-Alexandrium_andersonii.AAC.1
MTAGLRRRGPLSFGGRRQTRLRARGLDAGRGAKAAGLQRAADRARVFPGARLGAGAGLS